ncbi:MAG: hypothetical protein AAGI91_03860 [Bacteroidota bacterium]
MRALCLLALLALAAPAAAQPITLAPEIPVANQELTLRFAAPVDTVFVTYRPNSAVAQRDTIRVGEAQSMRWTPKRAGVVRIGLPDGTSQNVSVRFAATPLAGVLVLLFAGLILFGGATWAMRKLFSEGSPGFDPNDLPDT